MRYGKGVTFISCEKPSELTAHGVCMCPCHLIETELYHHALPEWTKPCCDKAVILQTSILLQSVKLKADEEIRIVDDRIVIRKKSDPDDNDDKENR